ncbi:MAG: chemotaxis protein CheA [Bacteroidales bacterium]|nr:chemotaxis protein CheA [Bacteroidales bacterium]
MEELKKKYYDEATQLVTDLEDAFLRVDEIGHEQTVNTVFRAVHSLKGGASIFGFDLVTDFSHHLENLFSNLRNNKEEVSSKIIQIGLTSSDILRKLLDNEIDEKLEETINSIKSEISEFLDIHDEIIEVSTNNEQESVNLFCIEFIPKKDIFLDGTNPLYIIEELDSLGDCEVFHYMNLPAFKDYNIENCYSSWRVFLHTKEHKEAINDIFLFVLDENHVEIEETKLSDSFNFKKFRKLLKDSFNPEHNFELDDIKSYIEKSSELKNIKKEDIDKKLSNFSKANKITSVRVDNDKIDMLLNIMSEIVIQQASLNLFSAELKNQNLTKITSTLESLTKQLRETVFDISLIPFSETISRFKRLIFELSQATGKEINFRVTGEQIELDKNLIETIIDPLIHLIRNCVDHGLELPQERIKVNKPSEGLIYMDIQQRGDDIILNLGDDGRGINLEKVRQRAIERDLIVSEAKLTDEELLQYIFLPGFSTAENVTEISGRGVGMDVVKQNIEMLRGSIRLSTEAGKGTEFILRLPVTVSIQDGFIFSTGDTKFILPAQQVINFSSLTKVEFDKIYKNLLDYNGREIPVYNLADELNLESQEHEIRYLLILQHDENEIAIIVDQIHSKQQFVIKPIGKYYRKLFFLTGATILGNGEIALIIDSTRLLDFLKNKTEIK